MDQHKESIEIATADRRTAAGCNRLKKVEDEQKERSWVRLSVSQFNCARSPPNSLSFTDEGPPQRLPRRVFAELFGERSRRLRGEGRCPPCERRSYRSRESRAFEIHAS